MISPLTINASKASNFRLTTVGRDGNLENYHDMRRKRFQMSYSKVTIEFPHFFKLGSDG